MTYAENRRQFLRYLMAGAVSVALPRPVPAENSGASGGAGVRTRRGSRPDVELEFVARVSEVSILSGAETSVFKYHGRVVEGPPTALTALPGYLGPMLNLERGQKVRIVFHNELAEPSIMHWHGMHVPQEMDGHPMYVIAPGERYVYEFEVRNPAGTYWYHAHPHDMTGPQVYRGQAGLIRVFDGEERALGLPGGEYDLPLIIQDRRFTAGNQLQYIYGMHERMTGFLGDTILVNGKPGSIILVKTRAYRMRVLNGSNSRIYKLGWQDGTPLVAIGTDGGLLAAPEIYPYIMLAPGERVELWVDFSGREPGSDVGLHSLEFDAPQMGMGMIGGGMRGGRGMGGRGPMRGMHGRRGMNGLAQGDEFPIAQFRIAETVSDSPELPSKLVNMRSLAERDVANAANPIPIAATMGHMSALLNGRSFEMEEATNRERIPVNTIQKIRITNEDAGDGGHMGGMGGMGMMGMGMPHPIHLHGQQFRVLSRKLRGGDRASYATVEEGFIRGGWKDTVLVMPGEEVDIVKPFEDYTGLFLYHCHNLEHEDLGMMRNFLVT